MVLIQSPQPGAKTVELEIGPVARLSIGPVEAVARMEDFRLCQCFTRARFCETCAYEVLAFVDTSRDPFMKTMRAFVLTCQIHSIGNERTVAEPAIVIRREIRT